jgi:3-hydroxyacyl-CoA dehydrogenase
VPGFLVNRLLGPYLDEAVLRFVNGANITELDAAARRFGMPMGPFELLDEVGTDVAHKVGDVLHAGLGARMQPSPLAAALHAAGRLGRKSGSGMYVHARAGKRRPEPDRAFWSTLRPDAKRRATDANELQDRVFGLMIQEAGRCLDEGIVGSAAELDLALVYGIGFPPFRGGLLQYADARGLEALVTRLRELESQLGSRFAPADRLNRMIASGERFFLDPRTAARG